MLAAGVIAWIRNPMIGFLILSYFVILAPSSTIVPLHLAFEHRVYLSLAALIIGVVVLALAAYRRVFPETDRAESIAFTLSSDAHCWLPRVSVGSPARGTLFITTG